MTETDCNPNKTIVSYTYGTGKMTDSTPSTTNGQPTQVTDGLSGVVQTICYNATAHDGGLGQVNSVSEADPNNTAGATYTYTGAGDRSTATYTSGIASSTTRWRYTDYTPLGDPASPSKDCAYEVNSG